MQRAFRSLRSGVMAAVFLLAITPGFAAESASTPTTGEVAASDWPDIRDRTFAMVWETVNSAYYDPSFGGVDWVAMREKYRAGLPDVADKPALRQLLTAMLGELQRTHFSILPREATVFTPAERTRIGTAGVEVAFIEESVVVSAVKPGPGAVQPPVRPGEKILSIGGYEMEPLIDHLRAAGVWPARIGFYLTQLVTGQLHSPVGSRVPVLVQGVDGVSRTEELVMEANDGVWSEPVGNFPSVPLECRSENNDGGLAYLHFNVFARQAMKDIRALLHAVPTGGGLVIDLRGNPGGIVLMASGISGWLSDRSYLMATMLMRQGHLGFSVNPQEGAFLGPVALLIDSGSASTSEIMAAGLQEVGRARIFGEPSPGAALPSVFKTLPTGDLFQYAIADLQTPLGVVIEGRGVTPDEIVTRTRADLAAGRDPVLSAARRWLEAERGGGER